MKRSAMHLCVKSIERLADGLRGGWIIAATIVDADVR